MKQHFEMFAAYNKWANRHLYNAAAALPKEELERNMGAFFKSMLGTLNHMLAGDRIWMKRFTGEGEAPTALDAMLFPAFATLRAAREAEDARIHEWVGTLKETELSGRFTYLTITDMRTVSQRLRRRWPTSSTTRRTIAARRT